MYEMLCSVPWVAGACPGEIVVFHQIPFSFDSMDTVALASAFSDGFLVVIPVLLAVYGVHMIVEAFRKAS